MRVSLVVPVLNEQDAIPVFHHAVRQCPKLVGTDIEIVFINDGSTDNTQAILDELAAHDSSVVAVHFTRNFGKEPALFAGLEHATGDAVIPMDVDMQDPIETVPDLIEAWQKGFDIVLAKRVDRESDTWLKRKTAELFYKIHNFISRPAIEPNVGDFRLLSRRIVNETIKLQEKNLFMKGVLSWVGGKQTVVEYVRAPRVSGKTKFNGWKLWNLALEGFTSFSSVPLRFWTYFGMIIAIFSLIFAAWTALETIIWGNTVSGYTSIFVAILFFGGVQLISIGVLGEYIGRIYTEVKGRPRYIIEKISKSQF
jgi:glycosyltransferase involved in cell wall biosynthesis